MSPLLTEHIDRTSARALVEAGYMPLSEYIGLFGDACPADILSPSTVPDYPLPARVPQKADQR